MAIQWYAIKTFYRSKVDGRPERPDLYYDPDATLVEERIVLIKAKNRKEAISKGEREALDYAQRGSCINPYNQKIITYYTGFYDLFEVAGNLVDKSEIFSSMRIMSKKIPDKKIAQVYIGKRVRHYAQGKGKKFSNRDYADS